VFALVGVFTVTSASAKDQIVLCTIDDLSGDFSIMSTPKTYGYKLAVKEINDAGAFRLTGPRRRSSWYPMTGNPTSSATRNSHSAASSTTKPMS
jgi:hypothetical protein